MGVLDRGEPAPAARLTPREVCRSGLGTYLRARHSLVELACRTLFRLRLMDDSKLRAWWWHRQGLDGSLRGESPARVLERAGWSRSVGGAGPYLTLFSRARIGREDADAAAASLEIHELPTARGCTYVVPSSDFALGLQVGQAFGDGDV